jgi:anti-anti-sigma factor
MQLSIIRPKPVSDEEPITLQLVGSIDLATRDVFLEEGEKALASRPPGLHIDAGGVDFVDSVGISALIDLEQMARTKGVPFSIGRQSPRLERVLNLAGLHVEPSAGLLPH